MRYLKHLIGLCLLALACNLSAEPLGDGIELDYIVAVVNDDVVMRSELDSGIERIRNRFTQAGEQPPPAHVIEKQVLEQLILLKLQMQAAANLGIQVDEETLARAVNDIARRNGLTLRQMRQTLAADGVSFRAFREKIRDEITLSRLRSREINNRIRVTDNEIRTFLEQNADIASERSAYRIEHILIATPEGATPRQMQQARQRAQRIIQSLNNGADFRATAQQESDASTAIDGGDLGWLPAAQVPSLFAAEVANMQRGEIRGPLSNASGLHIIRLVDFKGGERTIIEQSHVRHILLRTSEVVSDDEARNRLEILRQRIVGGDDFATLARSHSEDKASAIKGGDLGWVSPGDLVPRFEEELGRLQPGEISQPFRTEFGWHLAQLLERRQYDNTDEVRKNEAREAIIKRKSKEATELYLRRLRSEAYVEIRLNQENL